MEIANEKIVVGFWTNLKAIYVTKSLVNRIYLKKKYYTLTMAKGTQVKKHINIFNKGVLDLEIIDMKIEDDDQVVILLSSLLKSYDHFVETLTYGQTLLSMTDINAALNSKILTKKQREKNLGIEKGLIAKGKLGKQEKHGQEICQIQVKVKSFEVLSLP